MVEEEKLDHITGQKESEIPVFEESLKATQDLYFVLTKYREYDTDFASGVKVIGIYRDGLLARSAMDELVLNDGFKPSDIMEGSPEKVIVKRYLFGQSSMYEYKIWQTKVE